MAGGQVDVGGAIQGGAAGFKMGGPWGAAAGAALGGFGSYIKSGGDNSDYQKHYLTKVVKEARRAGIHPLYALGASNNFSPLFKTGSEGTDIGGAIRQAGADYSAEQTAKANAGMSNRIDESIIRRNDAAANLDNTQAALAASNDALNRQAMAAQQRDRIGTMLDQEIASKPDVFGLPPLPVANAMQQVQLPDGRRVWIPNQNVMETGELMGAAFGAKGAYDTVVPSQVSSFKRYKQRGGFDYKSYGNTGSKRGKSAWTQFKDWYNSRN
ncbi:MAG: hypothetical protein [Microviridae sp.]|nr:MAG: hypothetical protein [Microviridae sp.]